MYIECQSQNTEIVFSGSSTVKASLNETVSLTCVVSPTIGSNAIQFSFNNTIYKDLNFRSVSYPIGITVNSTYHSENCSLESTLIIEHFDEQFVGEYKCSARTFGSNGVVGENVTFNVTLKSFGQETSKYMVTV